MTKTSPPINGKLLIPIAIVLIAYFFAFQGKRGLWEPDEGRYTAVAMEMMREGNWLQPHLNPEHPHWTKPPLTYWAIAASVACLGRNAFAARLPSTLAFFLTTYLVYLLGRLFLKRRAWLAPLVYASFLLPAAASNIITTDGLLTLWETAALCAFAYAVWGDNKAAAPTWMLGMWAAFGLAFLTKGPPGLLPLTAIVVHRRWRAAKAGAPRLRWLTGLLVMSAIGLPWFAFVIAKHPGLARYFILHEVYGRIVTGEQGRNNEWYKAFVVYLPVLVLGTLPWTFWLARHAYRRARALLHFRGDQMDRSQTQDLFLLLWILCPLLVFMLSSSRLPLYLLPLFVPMALLAARGLEAASFSWNRRQVAWVSAWCVLLVSLRLVAAKIPTAKNAATLARRIKAVNTAPFSEIAFYATDPVRGLDIYLNKEVEGVSTNTLADELGEGENRLWILPPNAVTPFLAATAARGQKVRLVGRIGKRYLLFQNSRQLLRAGILPKTKRRISETKPLQQGMHKPILSPGGRSVSLMLHTNNGSPMTGSALLGNTAHTGHRHVL